MTPRTTPTGSLLPTVEWICVHGVLGGGEPCPKCRRVRAESDERAAALVEREDES